MPDDRTSLEERLRMMRTRLLLRAVLRAAVYGLGVAALGVVAATVFLHLLPSLLMGQTPGVWTVFATGFIGLMAGIAYELRGFRVPTMQDAALALESRLESDSGALAAALKLNDANVFAQPVLNRASRDLDQAEKAPAPALVTTRRLLWIPAVALLAALALGYVVGTDRAQGNPVEPERDATAKGGDWSTVDVGGERTTEEKQAYRDALGLKETQASLRQSAATLRDANSSPSEHRKALDDARRALEKAREASPQMRAVNLPDDVPPRAEAREELADRLEEAAGQAGTAAETRLRESGGSTDSGQDGEFNMDRKQGGFVPFPPMEKLETDELPGEALAAQSPARRALAERAVKAYEEITHP